MLFVIATLSLRREINLCRKSCITFIFLRRNHIMKLISVIATLALSSLVFANEPAKTAAPATTTTTTTTAPATETEGTTAAKDAHALAGKKVAKKTTTKKTTTTTTTTETAPATTDAHATGH
jgi:hypothetical protein